MGVLASAAGVRLHVFVRFSPIPTALRQILLVTVLVGCHSREERSAPAAAKSTTPAGLDHNADRAAFDRVRRPEQVIAALGLAQGQRIADVGAGRGYLTFRLAQAVGPTGRVVATDIDEGALAALRAHQPAVANVVVRKVAPDDPGLEPNAYDLILLSEVDHEFADAVAFLKKLRTALAPGGRIAVTNRRPRRAPLLAAAERAGYTVVGEVSDLPLHYLLFLQPAGVTH